MLFRGEEVTRIYTRIAYELNINLFLINIIQLIVYIISAYIASDASASLLAASNGDRVTTRFIL